MMKAKEKLLSIMVYAALGPILLALLLPTGCTPRTESRNVQVSGLTPGGQQQSSVELLGQVQRFAADDEGSARAWQDLLKRNRQNLINDLNGIVVTLDPDDRNRVLIAFTLCRLNHEYHANRKIVLSALSKNQPYKDFGGDWAVYLVAKLMMQGDKELLEPLFSAAAWTDGAMSYELAAAYSQALVADPDAFLRKLIVQPKSIRTDVISMFEDHTLTPEEKRKVKIHLSSIPRNSELHSLMTAILVSIDGRTERSNGSGIN
ncbi:MAG TPA: hypothetical protein VF290_01145 [Pyrinomonadaceae bacterium]